MFSRFIQNFQELPSSNRAMIYLMWIYFTGGMIGTFFVNIYVFQLHRLISDVLYYNLVLITAMFTGFSGLGALMAAFRKDIKWLYYVSYSAFIIAFLCLLLWHGSFVSVLFFGAIYGIGCGAIWCSVHTQELVHIADIKRDLYSSSITAGNGVISVIMPFFISSVFFLSTQYLRLDGYIILFLLLPFLYITSFFFIRDIESYTPSPITKADVRNFFNFRKYAYGLLYITSISLYHGIAFFISAIVSIRLLQNETSVGLFQGIMSVISVGCIIFLSHKRNPGNRIRIMWYIIWALLLNHVLFALNFSVEWYVIFSLVGIVLMPLFWVSEHVYDLKIMDTIKHEGWDFFPAMILREGLLWLGRFVVMGGLLLISLHSGWSLDRILQIGIVAIPIFMLLSWVSIRFHLKYESNEKGVE